MKKKFMLFCVFLFVANSASAAMKISGKYKIIGNIDDLRGAKKVTLVEYFNFSCGHCYKFLETAKRLEKKYKDKLVHKSVPIFWGKQTPYPSMAYFVAADKGIGEQAKNEIFNAKFQSNINVFDFRMISFIASSLGIGEKFEKASRSPEMKSRISNMQTLMQKYNVDQTPTIIINDVLKVNPGLSGGDVGKMTDNLDRIIEDILNN